MTKSEDLKYMRLFLKKAYEGDLTAQYLIWSINKKTKVLRNIIALKWLITAALNGAERPRSELENEFKDVHMRIDGTCIWRNEVVDLLALTRWVGSTFGPEWIKCHLSEMIGKSRQNDEEDSHHKMELSVIY